MDNHTGHTLDSYVITGTIHSQPGSSAPRPERRGPSAARLGQAALLVAAWSAPAALNVAMNTLARQRPMAPGELWPRIIVAALPWYVWAPLTPLVRRLVRERPLLRPLSVVSVVAHLALVAVATFVFVATLQLVRYAVGFPPGGGLVVTAIAWSPFTLLAYVAVAGIAHAALYARRARDEAVQRAVLAEQLTRAQLDALRMQLNPHFLFNALNTISMLVRDRDANTAVRLIAELGGILRELLRDSDAVVAALGREIDLVSRYLAIEQVRFGDRLAIDWAVAPGLFDAAVPPLILQPLVENAIRHGIARGTGGGWVRIEAEVRDATLVLTVSDNGPYGPRRSYAGPTSTTRGLGIANTRERLRQLYGEAAYVRLARADGGVTVATIALPLSYMMGAGAGRAAASANEDDVPTLRIHVGAREGARQRA